MSSVEDRAMQEATRLAKHRDELQIEVTRLREACRELAAALSRISYMCGPPNDQGVSIYDVAPDPNTVVTQVTRVLEANEAVSHCHASPYGIHRCVHCDSEITE